MSNDPDRPPLDAERLAHGDPDLLPGVVVEVVEQAESTNAAVADRARAGAAEGLVVVAEHQTAGRGRLDRTWLTPARSALTFSTLLRPSTPPRTWPWLPLLAGYAVDKTLKADGYDAAVKWPNDVLVNDRKVAGILTEVVDTDLGQAVVLGIGLNVTMTAEELPVGEATSLALEPNRGVPLDRTNLLLALLQTLWEAYAAWQAGGDLGAVRLAESYTAACATLGREVRVELPSGEALTGTASRVDHSGRLVVETAGGPAVVGAGDVVHVRPLPK